MTTVATKGDTRIARPLRVLVPLIQEELAAGDSAGLEHYRQAGVMLNEARAQVAAFKWGAWLSKNFELSRATATRYMKLATLAERGQIVDESTTLREAIGERRSDSNLRVGGWAPIRDLTAKVDTAALAQERQTREEEVRLHRDLALDLIEAGYRALAIRLHPDKGGSKAAMQRLHRVRDDLKSLASTRRFV